MKRDLVFIDFAIGELHVDPWDIRVITYFFEAVRA
jgi:hypothetical protein